MLKPGEWIWCITYRQVCQVIESQAIFGEMIYRVWLPTQDAIVRLRSELLKPLHDIPQFLNHHYLSYVAVAARIAVPLLTMSYLPL